MTQALVLLAEGFEELEAVTVINILRRGGVSVVSAGLHSGPVRGARGMVIVPDSEITMQSADDYDLLVLPGGQPGTRNLHADPNVRALLEQARAAGQLIAAICAAPSILADYGFLQGKRATGYPGTLMQRPGVTLTDEAVVVDGNIVTSRGPGTAMDFALILLDLLAGPDTRQRVERSLVRG